MREKLSGAIVFVIGLVSTVTVALAQIADDSREKSEKVSEILAALQAGPGKLIADVGAGEGFYSLENAVRRWRGNLFRTFVHPPAEMQRIVEAAGFKLTTRRCTLAWSADVFVRPL
jgi:predicted methyltransferase